MLQGYDASKKNIKILPNSSERTISWSDLGMNSLFGRLAASSRLIRMEIDSWDYSVYVES